MKKIPTLFERKFEKHKIVGISPTPFPGLEYIANGAGIPTVKVDGACCAIFDGKLWKRYDAKRGKKPPEGAIPCDVPDPVTGHWPHWVFVDRSDPADKWFAAALNNSLENINLEENATYEAIGPRFRNNSYNLDTDILVKHGSEVITDLHDHSFEGIRQYLTDHYIEGIVFWDVGRPICKIKRSDFGFDWK